MTRRSLAAQTALGGGRRSKPKKVTKRTRKVAKVKISVKGSPAQVKKAVQEVVKGESSGSGQIASAGS
jgi:hypothetical protein